jgi:hypothetical protein
MRPYCVRALTPRPRPTAPLRPPRLLRRADREVASLAPRGPRSPLRRERSIAWPGGGARAGGTGRRRGSWRRGLGRRGDRRAPAHQARRGDRHEASPTATASSPWPSKRAATLATRRWSRLSRACARWPGVTGLDAESPDWVGGEHGPAPALAQPVAILDQRAAPRSHRGPTSAKCASGTPHVRVSALMPRAASRFRDT